MLSNISIVCFAASYAIALAVEIAGLKVRVPARRAWLVLITLAGLAAHTIYLWNRANESQTAPLASSADWLLLAAWVLAVVYLSALFYLPRAASGLFLLPLVLALIATSLAASEEPFSPERASRFWGGLHGSVLLLGTVTVCIGFAAGVMYLLQSYWLKHRRAPGSELRLPSLEWLEKINTAALAISALFVALGFISGLVLSQLRHRGEADYRLWADPVVWSLAAMLVWLIAAETFRLVYPAARRGRKVAYLTLASFVFLVVALALFVLVDTVHGNASMLPNGAHVQDALE
jgi:ABC-type uncharacterized transport system permease subunit